MLSALNLTKARFRKVYAENAFWDPIAREIAVRSDLVEEPWNSWIGMQLSNFEEPDLEKVLLHGDLTQDHVLLIENEGEYSISGVIDFGDARIGHPFYDFIVPLLHYVYGEPVLSEELIKGYGLAVADDLRDVLTRYCLLHEFATLDDHLERVPTESPSDFQSRLRA